MGNQRATMGEPDVFVISVDFQSHVFSGNNSRSQPVGVQSQNQAPPQQPSLVQPDSRPDERSPTQQPPPGSPTTEDDFDLQLAEELGRIFRHYCAGGYSGYDVLPAENFY